jgi:hypothetical protein
MKTGTKAWKILGWSNDDTEYHFSRSTEVGKPRYWRRVLSAGCRTSISFPNRNGILQQNLTNLSLPLTEWFPSDVASCARRPRIKSTMIKIQQWPFPTYADMGRQQRWSEDSIAQWRGLAEDPGK